MPENPVPINPYESPAEAPAARPDFDGGVWQCANFLVVHRRASLPPICLKSGRPATQFVTVTVFAHTWISLMGWAAGPLGWLLMVALFSRRARISIGLCDEWAARRQRMLVVGESMFFGGLAVTVLSVILGLAVARWMFLQLIPGIVLAIIGACVVLFGSSLVVATRITSEFIWLRGVNRHARDRFPHWPWG